MNDIHFFLFSEFLQCIKKLYNCQEAGISRSDCQNVELCIPQPRFEDSDEELIEDKPVVDDDDDDSIEEIIPSYLPPPPSSSKVPQDSKPILDSGLGLVPPPNGHGRPVGTYTDKEMARPSTTTQRPANKGPINQRPANQRPPSNQRPANQRPTDKRPTNQRPKNKRPSTVYHPTQRKFLRILYTKYIVLGLVVLEFDQNIIIN